MKRALLIEFDLNTGRRAGGISPHDPNLRCYGWQNLDSVPAREIRLVEDDRDLSQYEGVSGITILNGEVQINRAIDNVVPKTFNIQSETLFLEDLRQRAISLSDYTGWEQQAILKDLHKKGIVGIRKRPIMKVGKVGLEIK